MKQAIFQLTVKTLETSNALKQDPKTLQNEQSAQTRLKDPMKQALRSTKSQNSYEKSNLLKQGLHTPSNKQCAPTRTKDPIK